MLPMNNDTSIKTTCLGWLALLTSMSTLICCVLPILLVTLGFGAVVASLTYHFPVLITLGEQEVLLLGVSGVLLAVAALFNFGRKRACPTDPDLALRCRRINRWNKIIFWTAVCIWSIGFSTRFLLYPVAQWMGYL